MKTYEIWAEGFSATGEHGTATLLGTVGANSFEEAVKQLAAGRPRSDRALFNLGRNPPTYWGCRLFDNGQDARKSYG